MAKIRIILKSSKDADEKESDASKQSGRFHQGRGVRPFYVKRKEDDGSVKVYSNKDANVVLANMENRASDILKGYNEKHINWGLDQFRSDFINAPKRELFLSFAQATIQQEYTDRGKHKTATVASEALRSMEIYDNQLSKRAFQDISVKYLNGYIDFCCAKGNSDTTLKIRLGEIRMIYNIAIREGVASQELYPFSNGKEDGKVRIPKTKGEFLIQVIPNIQRVL